MKRTLSWSTWALLLGACSSGGPDPYANSTAAASGEDVETLVLDDLTGTPTDPAHDPGEVWLHAMGPTGPCAPRPIGKGELVGTPYTFRGISASALSTAAGCDYVWVGPDDARPTASEVRRLHPDVVPLPLSLHATAVQEGGLATGAAAQAQELARRDAWREWFLTRAGAWNSTATPMRSVKVVVIDDFDHAGTLARAPGGVASWVAAYGSPSRHGAVVARVVQELSCPLDTPGPCLVDVSARAALVNAPQLLTPARVGDAVTFHQAVVDAIFDNATNSDPLVLNVSLGAKLDGTAAGVLSRSILTDALELAACNGAVIVASSGNILSPNILDYDELSPAEIGSTSVPAPSSCPARVRPASAGGFLGDLRAHVLPVAGVSSPEASVVAFDPKGIEALLYVPLHIGRAPDTGSVGAYGHNAVVDFGGTKSPRFTGTSISAAVVTAGLASVVSYVNSFELTDVVAISRAGPKTVLEDHLGRVGCFLPSTGLDMIPAIDVVRLLDGTCTANMCGASFAPARTGVHPAYTPPGASDVPLFGVVAGTGGPTPDTVMSFDGTRLIASPSIVDHPLLGPQPEPIGPCGICQLRTNDLRLVLTRPKDYDAYVLEVTSPTGYQSFRLDEGEIAQNSSYLPTGELSAFLDMSTAFAQTNVGAPISARLLGHDGATRTWRGSEVAVY